MNIDKKVLQALKEMGKVLPDRSHIELCVLDAENGRTCHKFNVIGGEVHHSESHSHDFVLNGTGPLP